MKGHRLHGADTDTVVERAQPPAHLARGPLGERHREHLAGRDVSGCDEVGDAAGDGAGLSRACSGKYAHRPAGGEHGFTLLVVEVTRDEFALAGGGLDRHAVHLGRAL